MSPKEKANELFDKYNYELSNHIFNGTFDIAKECALIAVDDVLKLGKKLPLETLEYYLEVRKEIEKL